MTRTSIKPNICRATIAIAAAVHRTDQPLSRADLCRIVGTADTPVLGEAIEHMMDTGMLARPQPGLYTRTTTLRKMLIGAGADALESVNREHRNAETARREAERRRAAIPPTITYRKPPVAHGGDANA